MLRLSLIGMSGAGKSHWSRLMEKSGFRRYSCDELIGERLGDQLGYACGQCHDLAAWMGHPYEDRYAQAEATYLTLEHEVVEWICEQLQTTLRAGGNVVVDTSGSMVYLGEKLIRRLKSLTTMVHLSTPETHLRKLYQTFLEHPKPLVWKGHYKQEFSENRDDALARCYQELLKSRRKEYEKFAECTLDYATLHEPGFNLQRMLEQISGFSSNA